MKANTGAANRAREQCWQKIINHVNSIQPHFFHTTDLQPLHHLHQLFWVDTKAFPMTNICPAYPRSAPETHPEPFVDVKEQQLKSKPLLNILNSPLANNE